ncbi:MAG: hypothetical protein GKR93_12125 [Gammaproteobacteria bacterium]|nr:hypothetical protein [Gammaproteobacteria bacterium]
MIHYNVDEMLDSQGMARTNRNRHAMHLAIKNITAVENPDQDINITWSNS